MYVGGYLLNPLTPLVADMHTPLGFTPLSPWMLTPRMQTPPDADPLLLDADPPVMWLVMHAGKPTPLDWQTPVKILPWPKQASKSLRKIVLTMERHPHHETLFETAPGTAVNPLFLQVDLPLVRTGVSHTSVRYFSAYVSFEENLEK